MRVVLQSEAAECGIACVVMLASHFGHGIGLSEARRRFRVSLKGAKLSQLIAMAKSLGMSTRPVRLEMEHVPDLKLPCILHWRLNHFVVLTGVSGKNMTIIDPAIGERRVSIGEFSDSFTGVALEATPELGFKKKKAARSVSLSDLTGPVQGLRSSLLQIVLLSLGLQVLLVTAPFYMQWVVDHALVSADKNLLAVLGLSFGAALLLQVAIGFFRGWAVIHLSALLGVQWLANVFAHAIRLPLDFFERRHLGDVTSRLSSLQSIQKTLTTSFVEAMIDGLMTAVTLILMFVYSWKLALVSVGAMTAYLVARACFFQDLRDRTEQQLVAAANQETHLLESIRGVQSIKVSGKEMGRESTFLNLIHTTMDREVRLSRISLGFSSTSQIVFGVERVAAIWIGAWLTIQGVFSVGMLIAYLVYKDQFSSRVGSLVDKWVELRMLRLHGERLGDIVFEEPELREPTLERLDIKLGDVAVDNVGFRYSESEPWIIRSCSFIVHQGESIAIVGASGGGKTTLLKLILGLLKPSEGTVRIGGVDIHKLGVTKVRSHIGTVMQDDQLFAGSIAENISFFDPEMDTDRVRWAASLACIHDDILEMPLAYDGLIGDMGNSLSGGQKQRLVLARALYRMPDILILDEATSHLDVVREQAVNIAIKDLNLTRIIVAHRPETIASADRVLVLEGGRVARQFPGSAMMSSQNQKRASAC
ncbi:peptidase domain-containing ABC transporter [Stenotrophomonas maltophilia]|uniref:peptidase domain-containing ABC transporter n=1 Tax=Stenotrophomonas maltophilia TaxID=40324 RepID=UPI00067B51FA|nr:peptidase domain-containing ABC transporter [Stenotrophomonas maltophilia]